VKSERRVFVVRADNSEKPGVGALGGGSMGETLFTSLKVGGKNDNGNDTGAIYIYNKTNIKQNKVEDPQHRNGKSNHQQM
jgi:hypothetical protein